MQERKNNLTQADLKAIGETVANRLKTHECTRGLTDDDAVFVRHLRKSAEHTMSKVWNAFLLMVGLGILVLLIFGLFAAGLKLVKNMGV